MALDRDKFKIMGNNLDVAHMWPEKDHPLEVGDSVEGTYVEKVEGVGRHESNVYILETAEGDRIGVWGSTVIDENMKDVEPGTVVGFEFAGMRTGKNGEYKDFRVGIAEAGPL
jgi:hypothetical protein